MNLTGEYQTRLIKLMDDFRKSKPASLHSVLDEVSSAIKYGEIVDAYQARYIRDALHSSEEIKSSNEDLVDLFEKNFFA